MDAIYAFSDHVVSTKFSKIPVDAIESAKKFILDSIGVAIAGSAGQWTEELVRCATLWGAGGESRLFVRGSRLPCATAALVNAYQMHNSEFDCIHESAVVHAMTAVLPAALAVAERSGGVPGTHLIEAVVTGVDVACAIGLGATSKMKFFRPGVAGGFGATAAIGKLLNFDQATLVNAFGTLFSQSCGSMQAHEEGTMLLALQVGFNARNAVHACDLAAAGLRATAGVLEGRFGYYAVFEDGHDLRPVTDNLGRIWRVAELAQKPFPSGRATHGAIDAIITLKGRHQIMPDQIGSITIGLTPFACSLVGRPAMPHMEANYARLCVAYCAARALQTGALGLCDFKRQPLSDEATLDLARRVEIVAVSPDSLDPFAPSRVEIVLKSGERLAETVAIAPGRPNRPMPSPVHLDKVRTNCANGYRPLPSEAIEGLISTVGELEAVRDIRAVIDLAVAPA